MLFAKPYLLWKEDRERREAGIQHLVGVVCLVRMTHHNTGAAVLLLTACDIFFKLIVSGNSGAGAVNCCSGASPFDVVCKTILHV